MSAWNCGHQRRRKLKVSKELQKALNTWILNHPRIVPSPISNDTLWVPAPEEKNGKKKVHKLLQEVSFQELHNDLIKPVSEGGLEGVLDANNKPLISDTALRALAPPHLRKMTDCHKQMCGCTVCVSSSVLQSSLNAFRGYRRSQMATKLANMRNCRAKRALQETYDLYCTEAFQENNTTLHLQATDAMKCILCKPLIVDDYSLHHMKCALRRCTNCPSYKIPQYEQDSSNNAVHIKFRVRKTFSRCSIHGNLGVGRLKTCLQCTEAIADNSTFVKGKISARDRLTLLERPIGEFHEKFYLPLLEKLAYHNFLVVALGKNVSGKYRQKAFRQMKRVLKIRRDYAERLLASFAMEVQSDHFGNGRTLSMEGSSVEFYVDNEPTMEFHSHFSDKPEQNAATTFDHTAALFDEMKKRGLLEAGFAVLENTDGCQDQYRKSVAWYLLTVLATTYQVAIDRGVGAPGHGKDLVDGLNALDKAFLRAKMCMIGTPEADEREC